LIFHVELLILQFLFDINVFLFHHKLELIKYNLIFSHSAQVVEVNVKVEKPGDNNVHNNAFYAEEKLLKSELEAMRDCDPLSARHWIVSSY